jgi:uncharacterized protein YcbK (DUF882 family)
MNTAHFNIGEFACKHCGEVKLDRELLAVLQLVRIHFNSPVSITSGYRCEIHNRNVGGAKNSQHKLGTAADIVVNGIEPSEVHHFIDSIFPNSYGLGYYDSFTHIDVRDGKVRW